MKSGNVSKAVPDTSPWPLLLLQWWKFRKTKSWWCSLSDVSGQGWRSMVWLFSFDNKTRRTVLIMLLSLLLYVCRHVCIYFELLCGSFTSVSFYLLLPRVAIKFSSWSLYRDSLSIETLGGERGMEGRRKQRLAVFAWHPIPASKCAAWFSCSSWTCVNQMEQNWLFLPSLRESL